jgi:hypothetical protein
MFMSLALSFVTATTSALEQRDEIAYNVSNIRPAVDQQKTNDVFVPGLSKSDSFQLSAWPSLLLCTFGLAHSVTVLVHKNCKARHIDLLPEVGSVGSGSVQLPRWLTRGATEGTIV